MISLKGRVLCKGTCEKKSEYSTLNDFFFKFFVHIFVSLLKDRTAVLFCTSKLTTNRQQDDLNNECYC